jgi:putative phage tail component, N-terminal domain
MHDNFHTFWYDGKFLSDLGAVISQRPTYYVSTPDIEFFKIIGKSGSAIIDYNRYENKTFKVPIRAVPAYCDMTIKDFSHKLTEWLRTGDVEYKVYKDTYNPDYFRKAVVTEIDDIVAVRKDVYETTITFNCDPFLYSKSGLTEIEVNSTNYTITNSEKWDAEPIIKVNGNGLFTVSINDESFNITLDGTQITVDKPNENVYYTTTKVDCNDKYSANIIPELKPGVNTIAVETENGTNFSMSIIPNWRRL